MTGSLFHLLVGYQKISDTEGGILFLVAMIIGFAFSFWYYYERAKGKKVTRKKPISHK